MFNIKKIPFSRYGSFLTISPIFSQKEENPLYIRSVRGGDMGVGYGKVFRIEVINRNREILSYKILMKETELSLVTKDGKLSFCIEDKSIMRAYGEGVGLRLTMDAMSYDNAIPFGENRYRVISSRQDLKFVLTPLKGELKVEAPWAVDRSKYIMIEFLPDQKTKNFHGVLEEFTTSCKKRKYENSYQICLNRVRKEYEDWKEKVLNVAVEFKKGRDLASYITWSCVVPAEGRLTREAMYMSKNWMTNIWSWDHCFNALALIKNNPELAWEQLMIFFDLQDECGALPDFANDKYVYYCFTKPPIHGWTVNYMLNENPKFFTRERLEEIYEPLKKWTEYWFKYTDYYGEGLPSYNHGNDAGWDNSTIFHLGAPIQSSDLLSFLILQMKTLSKIADRLGNKKETTYWEEESKLNLDKLLKYFWNGERFIPRKHGVKKEKFIGDSLIMFIPIILGEFLPKEVKKRLVEGLKEDNRFLTEYGLATESIASEFYHEDGYWRGPIWAPSTMLIVDGLARAGEKDFACEVAKRFIKMANESGMAENFNALTGEGLRDQAFTWTSSVFLILANRYCS